MDLCLLCLNPIFFKRLAGYGVQPFLYYIHGWFTLPARGCPVRFEVLTSRTLMMAKSRTTAISADLGDLKALWLAWCQANQVTPSVALRQILGRAIGGASAQPVTPRRVLKNRREKAVQRMKLHMTASELAGLNTLAAQEGYRPTQWVVAMIRTRLTGQPHVG